MPAAALLFIAIYQMNAWADAKIRNPAAGPDGIYGTADDMRPTLEVTGRQFEWRLRYPGLKAEGKLGDADDIFVVNDLHLPVNEEILLGSEERRRAAQLFSAQRARQAGRRAGHEDSGLVPLPRKPAPTTWSAPSCAAGDITR